MNCKEYILDDVMAVIAIPVSDLDLGASQWQTAPTIAAASFSPSLTTAVTVGTEPAVTGGSLVPIRRTTGKVRDQASDAAAGRLHTVEVSCQADDRQADAWDLLLLLERTPSHLLLRLRGGAGAFVQATEDSYLCEVDRDGAETSLKFRIQNLMGLQLIRE